MINKIKKDKKIKFINVDNLTISKQRVVFSENSLLLDFKEAANIQKTKETKEGFFEINPNVSIHVVNQIIQDKDSLILEFNNKKPRVERNRT